MRMWPCGPNKASMCRVPRAPDTMDACAIDRTPRSRRDVLIARLQKLERAPPRPSVCPLRHLSPDLARGAQVTVDGPKPPSGAPLREPLSPRSRVARAGRETVGTASPRGTYVVGSSGRWTSRVTTTETYFFSQLHLHRALLLLLLDPSRRCRESRGRTRSRSAPAVVRSEQRVVVVMVQARRKRMMAAESKKEKEEKEQPPSTTSPPLLPRR